MSILPHKQNVNQSIFDTAKAVPILQTASGLGLDLKKQGQNYVTTCPFHADRIPSFTVFPGSNTFRCFGCGEYGDAVDLVAKIKGISLLQAARELAGDMPVGTVYISHKAQEDQEFKTIVDYAYRRLAMIYRAIHMALTPENLNDLAEWVRFLPVLEEVLNYLASGDKEKQTEVLNKEVIRQLCS